MMSEANIITIKESLHSIVRQLDLAPKSRPSNDTKACGNKIYNLLLQKNTSIEKFYFVYLTCQLCMNAKQSKVEKLMKILLPNPPTPQALELISNLISFALCHPSVYTSILDNLSSYLNVSDLINIEVESWYQAESLALDSPSFCSALLSRSDLPQLDIDKKLLAKWLQELSRTDQDFPTPSLNQLIKYSLFHQTPPGMSVDEAHKYELANSDFHFGILTLIQCKRCQTLTNQFLIEVVSTLVQLCDSEEKLKSVNATTLVDRFAQILSVAAASKVTSITNALRNSLGRLESNQLIASVIQWQNK